MPDYPRRPKDPSSRKPHPLLTFTLTLFLSASTAQAEDVLEHVVILNRHGVRSPTQDAEALKQWRKPKSPTWPDFGVQHPGDLTLKGAALIQGMGTYYREKSPWKSLFSPGVCPRSDAFIWADRDERTLVTAEALASGLAGGSGGSCRLTIGETTEAVDPLFHPTTAITDCKFDPPGDPPASMDQLKAVQEIVDCCSEALCTRLLDRKTCVLEDFAGWAGFTETSDFVQSFGEMLLLQYAQGFQGDQFAFGKIPPEKSKSKMLELLAIHTDLFNKKQRNDYVAKRQGDNLLYHLSYAIESGAPLKKGAERAKFIAYVGHDTNIANVAGILGLKWHLSEYPDNDIPPGTALAFEVRRSGQNKNVYAFIVGQSPDALRNLSSEFELKPVTIPGCRDGCSLGDFRNMWRNKIQNTDCITHWPPPPPPP